MSAGLESRPSVKRKSLSNWAGEGVSADIEVAGEALTAAGAMAAARMVLRIV